MNLKSLADIFLDLKPEQRAVAHFALCEQALQIWNAYVSRQGRIQYRESVVGTIQEVDKQLPADAFASAQIGADAFAVANRYQEPISAMQDDDLIFPAQITCAYYALYNLFRKYTQGASVDDWLIVNQAISSEEDSNKWDALLRSAIEKAA